METCFATGLSLEGKQRTLIPIKIRKVYYHAIHISRNKKTGVERKRVLKVSEGWETVKEVPVIKEMVSVFKAGFNPEVVGEKIVEYTKPRVPYKDLVKDKINFEEKYHREIEEYNKSS
jgi:hypothetical protein